MNYNDFPQKDIFCIDMKCFYASCIAMLEGLDVLTDPIAIIGNFEQPGSIVLAASPVMKEKFNIKTGNRRYEIPKHPDIKLFEPKMSFFLEMSMAITRLIAQYVPPEAIHVYSVDESFIDLTGTEQLWGSPEQVAKLIQEDIYEKFRIPSAIGMGPNMLMAKLALDLEAKKTGFAKWTYADVPTKLWPVRPLSDMWGIGKQMAANLNAMGIQTVGGLAHADLAELEKRFGIMGNQYYYHAWGIDLSTLGEPLVNNAALSFGKGQMLRKDYHTRKDIAVVLLEMCEDVMRRTREAGYVGRTVSLGLSYSRNAMTKGFHRSRTIESPTNETLVMYQTCLDLLDEHFAGEPARQLSVRLTNLEAERSIQLDLFDERKDQRQVIGHVMDAIRRKYGVVALLRAASYTSAGTAISRNRLVGGHLA
ncbi:UV damage repair protein UvrX [Lysinibacillus capsici]|uniref:Y-family DNA polymerase n=1 Tax=Lysinibacillus TaxID=400634 RepID=UPI0008254D0F|nr:MULTISPECIES: UV damage repair protein UvrX [Lysinibacillus]MDP1392647.1 UV damage repair protein UvrX [Lysinibacillus capsici]MDP1413122.1 UV damage repair protein UvrX [Lysinibacillus capsici]MDP1428245.1 UV damage repair protein UvrX [Lysinibacillus capsici]OCX62570.1 UV damage repair protein UvrX [Lysinibacillus sp. AR18-8]